MYGSKYLGVPDLKGQRPRRTIGKVEVAELKEKDGTTKRKRILYFEGEDKALVLNKTNAVKLAMAFGKESADWIGARVELYSEMTSLGKEGVRLQPLRTVAKARHAEAACDRSRFGRRDPVLRTELGAAPDRAAPFTTTTENSNQREMIWLTLRNGKFSIAQARCVRSYCARDFCRSPASVKPSTSPTGRISKPPKPTLMVGSHAIQTQRTLGC